MADRADHIAAFLADAGWGAAARRPLAGDASFRRYERLSLDERRAVLMDAPPPEEDVNAFHRVERLLLSLGLSAPRALAVNQAEGLMLLEDLGDRTFTRALAEGDDERALYELAVDVLIHLHLAADAKALAAAPLPDYDDGRLLLGTAVDWILDDAPVLNVDFSRSGLAAGCQSTVVAIEGHQALGQGVDPHDIFRVNRFAGRAYFRKPANTMPKSMYGAVSLASQ